MRNLLMKVLRLLFVVVAVSFITTICIRLIPGDPSQLTCAGADKAKCDVVRKDMGLDRPVVAQFGTWAKDFATGDLGKYYRRPEIVSDRVKAGLPVSLSLILYTQVVGLLIAIPLGVMTAYRAGGVFDGGANLFSFLALSIPGFIIGYVLKKFLALDLDLLPESGWVPITENVGQHFRHAILPVATLVLSQIAVYFRLLRSDMIGTLQEDFITMARAKGLRPRRILFRHALRPSSLTLLTVAGLNIGTLISSAVLVERIFGATGVGYTLVEAIFSREYVAVQSLVAVVCIIFVVINFAVDFLYTVIDPRIRHA